MSGISCCKPQEIRERSELYMNFFTTKSINISGPDFISLEF